VLLEFKKINSIQLFAPRDEQWSLKIKFKKIDSIQLSITSDEQ